MQLIQEFEQYPPIDQIFALVHDREDAVFLDSSMTNQLGRFSIIGLNPYLKLVKGGAFTINGTISEESYEDENEDCAHRQLNHAVGKEDSIS